MIGRARALGDVCDQTQGRKSPNPFLRDSGDQERMGQEIKGFDHGDTERG